MIDTSIDASIITIDITTDIILIMMDLPNRRKFYIFDRIYCEIYHQLEPPHIYPIIACCLFITKSASMMKMLASVDKKMTLTVNTDVLYTYLKITLASVIY
jgi:hypothetical protein